MRKLILVLLAAAAVCPAQYDVLIRNGRVIDGTGNPWRRTNIAINGDTIAAIGPLIGATAKRTIDARDQIVSPGFIDIHTHSRRNIEQVPTADNYLRQGVTTLIEGPDGSSELPLRSLFARVSAKGTSVNFGSMVGQGTVRQEVMGLVNRPATPAEIERMKAIVRSEMEAGALGLSTGLFYVPGNFTPTAEVTELARVAGEMGGIYISHMRDESDKLIESVKETIAIGENAHMPTQITHHKVLGAPYKGESVETLKLVEEARARGVDVTLDQYPYTASSTGLTGLVPQWAQEGGHDAMVKRFQDPAIRPRIKAGIVENIKIRRGGGDPKNVQLAVCQFDPSLNGKTLAQITQERGKEPTAENSADITMEILSHGNCQAVYHAIDESDIERIMKYPDTMIGSDGEVAVFGRGVIHPRSYGTFARVLGVYVRERKVITLQDAIRKMTSLPAQRMNLMDRGLLRPGMKADVVIFDPNVIADKAEYGNPHQYAVGVSYVLVNGQVAIDDGRITAARPGRILYGPAHKN
ncbi:MAG TPA: D-aminoacylase [Bryobacterales bacterium]|jgi:N-acyl-D-amino-acid deacylase|nr:D-aminoacylase [Bryobacterales bacterium]